MNICQSTVKEYAKASVSYIVYNGYQALWPTGAIDFQFQEHCKSGLPHRWCAADVDYLVLFDRSHNALMVFSRSEYVRGILLLGEDELKDG